MSCDKPIIGLFVHLDCSFTERRNRSHPPLDSPGCRVQRLMRMLALEPPTGLAPHRGAPKSLAFRPWQYLQTRRGVTAIPFHQAEHKTSCFPISSCFQGKIHYRWFFHSSACGGMHAPRQFLVITYGKMNTAGTQKRSKPRIKDADQTSKTTEA